jgi:hypothetical protein
MYRHRNHSREALCDINSIFCEPDSTLKLLLDRAEDVGADSNITSHTLQNRGIAPHHVYGTSFRINKKWYWCVQPNKYDYSDALLPPHRMMFPRG